MYEQRLQAARADETDQLRNSIEELAKFADAFSLSSLEPSAWSALRRVLVDSFAVMIAGGRLSESEHLRNALPLSNGKSSVFGDGRTTGAVDAAWLNGVSMVSLELDEGNKYIRGHASAHVLPACLALSEANGSTGDEFLSAFMVGHEIASRFGSAIFLDSRVHPHGNWGVAGAASACARLSHGDVGKIAMAIDNAGAFAIAGPFSAATSGMMVRNGWIGASNAAGIWASSLALSDHEGKLVGISRESLGELLGTLDPSKLIDGLGNGFFIESGYFKRHASCSYTHPPADAAIGIFEEHGPVFAEQVNSITVESHHLAAQLNGIEWPTRMAAMFSIPFVVSTAMQVGNCTPSQFSEVNRNSKSRASLASKVIVVTDEELDRRLPNHRAARIRIEWVDGTKSVIEVNNPVGDADHHPLDEKQIIEKSEALIGSRCTDIVLKVIDDLPQCKDVRPLFEVLHKASHVDTTSTGTN